MGEREIGREKGGEGQKREGGHRETRGRWRERHRDGKGRRYTQRGGVRISSTDARLK